MACQGCSDAGLTQTQVQNLINSSLPGYGGYSSKWIFSTGTSSNPGDTYLRFNSATYASVTTIYLDEVNAAEVDVSAFLGSLDNDSNYGYIRIFKEYDSNKFWYGQITAVTDSGDYYTLTVTYVGHNGTFSANDDVVVTFSPNGAGGTNGTDGTDGSTVEYSNITDTAVASDSETEIDVYDFSADATILASNGDELHIDLGFETTGASSGAKTISIYIGDFAGSSQLLFTKTASDPGDEMYYNNRSGYIEMKIKRIDATTIRFYMNLIISPTGLFELDSGTIALETVYRLETITVDLSALRQIQFTATNANGEIQGTELTARHYQI